MNTVRPRPYPQRTGNYNANNTGTDADGHNKNGQEQQQQHRETVARGRVEDVQQVQGQPRQAIYSPAVNAYAQKSAFPNQTSPMQGAAYPVQGGQINPQQYQAIQAQSGYQPISSAEPAPAKPAQRSNRINIAQILKDFRNTIKAIATPAEIEEDVNHYLKIVEQQVREVKPQVTQKRPAALFLQRIDYKYDAEDINPNFLVKFPEDNKKPEPQQEVQEEVQPEPVAEIEEYEPETLETEFVQAQEKIATKPNITIIPQDTRLKSLFMEAKKHAFSNNPQKAMAMFKEAFNRAGEIKDNETQSRICLEIGKIYDDNDFVVQALNSYNKSLKYTTDTNVKSKAHYSMAQIYDDVNQVGPALEHYITSISYAGKTDDLIGQSDSLTRVANIFTDKYDENAFEYYEVARKLVEQTADNNMKGYVLSNTADACVQFRKNDKALKYYAEAVKNYETPNPLKKLLAMLLKQKMKIWFQKSIFY